MKTLTLQQGSPEWLAHRRTTRNASDAPAMMGASPYVTRAQLVRQCASGVDREIDDATQKRFDDGHKVEPLLRALAEKLIGEDLYPVTGVSDDGYLGASFDGVTLSEDVIFEAKQSNAEKAACVARGELPPQDYWQIVQQFAVCDSAHTCFYFVGDGTEDGTVAVAVTRCEVADDIPKLLAAWAQFDADVAAYVPEPEAAPVPVGRTPDQLPALHIEVSGLVTASNLPYFRDAAIAVFQGISTDLQTDQDFADAERTVKWCGDIEDQLKAAKQHALGQTASIDELFRTIDAISAEARAKRLELDKLVKSRKESIRGEIVAAGVAAVRAHYDAINATLGQYRIDPPQSLTPDIGAAIKGKKSIASMRDAVDSAAASAKVAASQRAEHVRANVAILEQHAEHRHLFADAVQLAHSKAQDDLTNLIASRVREHQEREAARLERERERIRQEEAARLERERSAAEAQTNVSERAIEPVQQSPAAGGGQGDYTGELRAAGEPGRTIAKPPTSSPPVKLGDINAALAPLSITVEGLMSLGFRPVARRGAAKLYAGADFPAICAALAKIVADAPSRLSEQSEAA
jgi:putative phage-type endonuclease